MINNVDAILSDIMVKNETDSDADLCEKSASNLKKLLGHDLYNVMYKYGGFQLKDGFGFIPIVKNPMILNDGFDVFDSFLTLQDIDDMLNNRPGGMEFLNPDMIPIADVPGGDFLCICINGDTVGSIYHWCHDGDVLEPSGYDQMYLVEHSFEAFVKSIESYGMTHEVDLSKVKVVLDESFWSEYL